MGRRSASPNYKRNHHEPVEVSYRGQTVVVPRYMYYNKRRNLRRSAKSKTEMEAHLFQVLLAESREPVPRRGRPRKNVASTSSSTSMTTSSSSTTMTTDGILNDAINDEKDGGVRRKEFDIAMSISRRFEHDLGNYGAGLCGTLTAGAALTALKRLNIAGKTYLDVGAGDGRMMLGALALGAKRAYGIEITDFDALVPKFESMKSELQKRFTHPLIAALACGTDICMLTPANVSHWLLGLFGGPTDDDDVVVTAFWNGFTTAAKKTLLRAVAVAYRRVSRICLVGPRRMEFGDPNDILEFCHTENRDIDIDLVHDDAAPLSGSGGMQRALTFHLRKACSLSLKSPRVASTFSGSARYTVKTARATS